MSNIDTTIEKMRELVEGLERVIENGKDLTETQQAILLASDEFMRLSNSIGELCDEVDNATGGTK